ncbi:hypothetical protein SLE2022_099600 [Rubroshorea leprosula]
MAEKTKILIIGGTGLNIGKLLVEVSANSGHPTYVLVRESTVSDPVKGEILENFKNLGVKLLNGDINNHESLVKAIKQVDVVICAVGLMQMADQVKIISAIKEAGNIKRFFPSEFGFDPDGAYEISVEPAKPVVFGVKNQPGATTTPRDKVIILGDCNVKGVYNKKVDIATYTIRAVDDPRTLNKTLHVRPPKNTVSFNEVVAIWEKLIGKTLEKTYTPEEQILKDIQELPFLDSVLLSLNHLHFVKGDHFNFEIKPSFGVEASKLYPDVKYTTVEEFLTQFV